MSNRTTGNGALIGMATCGLLGLLFGAIGVIILGILGFCIGDYLERRQMKKGEE